LSALNLSIEHMRRRHICKGIEPKAEAGFRATAIQQSVIHFVEDTSPYIVVEPYHFRRPCSISCRVVITDSKTL
jgi:hypothetical protein